MIELRGAKLLNASNLEKIDLAGKKGRINVIQLKRTTKAEQLSKQIPAESGENQYA